MKTTAFAWMVNRMFGPQRHTPEQKDFASSWTRETRFSMKKRKSTVKIQQLFQQTMICSVSHHVSGNYTAGFRHSARVKHGMTIALQAKKTIWPYFRTKGAVLPMNCLTQLGVLYVHSKELVLPMEAALGKHEISQSIVLQPKITTSDDSLRSLPPKE